MIRRLRIIVVLMGIALLGLILFQNYWIRQAIKTSKEQFSQDVISALREVSRMLEQQEVKYTAVQRLNYDQGDKSVVSLDSIRFISKALEDKQPNIFLTEESITSIFRSENDSVTEENVHIISKNIELREPASEGGALIDEDVMVEIKRFTSEIDTVENYDYTIHKTIQKVEEKNQMVTLVLNELISKERKIDNRVDKHQLDTLIRASLLNRGINTDFSFAVIEPAKKEVVLTNDSSNIGNINSSPLKAKLFTHDIIDHNFYISAFFPDEDAFLIGKIWTTLLSSAILLLVIIFCFGYAVHIIMKQKKLSEVKNDFINNMTHEFKTPISTVSLACEALQDNDVIKSPQFVSRYLEIIKDENKRLARQVEKVLQMATLDKKEIKLKIQELDVHEVINHAVHNINLQVEKKGGKISRSFNAAQHMLNADEVHMTNIIYNLLDNANKYSYDQPEISVSTRNRNGGLIITVEDNGIGMTKEVTNKIFDKFYRVPTGNRHDVKGFGLGLAYVKTMTEALGGNVQVDSIIHKGSTFEIYFPQHD